MPGNSNLHDSSRNKQDEFYTNLQLIEDELKHYRAHFKGKRVLCNCDDPYESNFIKGNKVWLGNKARHFWFKVPSHYEVKAADFKVDENGQKWRRMGNTGRPDQFEMVGLLNHGQDNEYDFAVPRINGKTLFKRIIIRRRAEGETK